MTTYRTVSEKNLVDVLPRDLPYPGARLSGGTVFWAPNVVSEPKIEVAFGAFWTRLACF